MPPHDPRRSLQAIIRQRQQSGFVGREAQLQQFRWNLANPMREGEIRYFPHLIFNIWGQGGVGKTTLVRQFQQIVQDQETPIASAYLDEGMTDLPAAMNHLAKQLTDQGYDLKTFTDRYTDYRQKKQEIAADPDAPQGFSALVGRTVAKTGLRLAKRVPVGGDAIEELVDEDALTDQAGEWASYLAKKFQNKDDVRLVNEPETVLTPLFVEGLWTVAEQADLLLFLDTYEQTGQFLDQWLLDLLGSEIAPLPTNLVLVISGREPLDRNRWANYDGLIASLPLDPFSEEEATQFLARKGITEPAVVQEILALSGRLPLLVATLAAGNPTAPDGVGNPSNTAVERFLKWVTDPQQRQLALDAALPRRLNQDIIAQLLPEEADAEALFAWLKRLPFVQERSDGWGYHLVVRDLFLRQQRLTSPQRWSQLHDQLVAYYNGQLQALGLTETEQWGNQTWQALRVEQLYHQLCAAPQQQLAAALNGWVEAWKQQRNLAKQWAAVLQAAGQDIADLTIENWGQNLGLSLVAYEENQYDVALNVFSSLLQEACLEAQWQAIMFHWRGYLSRLKNRYPQALADSTQAIGLNPGYTLAIAGRGETYRMMERYEEALADYNRALELKPDYAFAIVGRARTYRLMERYEEALADYNRAIDLDPEDGVEIAGRGVTYRLMERYEEALADFNRALKLKPDYDWAIAGRAKTYRQMDRYEEALADYDRAIELDSENGFAIAGRGVTYRQMDRYEEALADFNRAIELKPDYDWAIAQRGVTYRQMERYKEALADFNRAIELKPDHDWAIASRGQTYHQMERYEEALADYNRAIELDPEDGLTIADRGETYRLMERYEESLADFNCALELKPDYAWAISSRGQTYQSLKRYEEALVDFNRAIELDPELDWATVSRGKTYRQMERYEESLADFHRAVELDPKNDWYYYERGLVYTLLDRAELAQADFKAAIDLAKPQYEDNPQDWQNSFNLALYYLAAGQEKASVALYKEAVANGATAAAIRVAIEGDLTPFLASFPGHALAQKVLAFLQSALAQSVAAPPAAGAR